jgi:DNA-binding transcriptional regulator GbsR (MarR family)
MSAKKPKPAKPTLPQEAIIAETGAIAESYGLTRIAGELTTLLFLESGPLSIGEMATRLQVTKPSVSTNIRFLERWHVVKKIPVRNDRRDFYSFSDDLWATLREAYEGVILKDARRLSDLLELIHRAEGDHPVGRRACETRDLIASVSSLAAALFAARPAAAGEVHEIAVE